MLCDRSRCGFAVDANAVGAAEILDDAGILVDNQLEMTRGQAGFGRQFIVGVVRTTEDKGCVPRNVDRLNGVSRLLKGQANRLFQGLVRLAGWWFRRRLVCYGWWSRWLWRYWTRWRRLTPGRCDGSLMRNRCGGFRLNGEMQRRSSDRYGVAGRQGVMRNTFAIDESSIATSEVLNRADAVNEHELGVAT